MEVVDEIVEGDAIASISFEKEDKSPQSRYAAPGANMRIVPASASPPMRRTR
jgi:hypothetical protein